MRRLVLAACGVAVGAGLLGGLAAPASAGGLPAPVPLDGSLADGATVVRREAGPDLDGLPLPDRAPAPGRPAHAVVVEAGDSLWDLAAADLERRTGAEASDAEVDRRWREVHRLNRAVVGDDPDLIRPGQRLRLPDPTRATPEK